ncbi:MAG: hypothetical protein U1E77_13280 [Inhella sp.]
MREREEERRLIYQRQVRSEGKAGWLDHAFTANRQRLAKELRCGQAWCCWRRIWWRCASGHRGARLRASRRCAWKLDLNSSSWPRRRSRRSFANGPSQERTAITMV